MKNQPKNARFKRSTTIPMGSSIVLGIVFGAAFGNIALGLVAGIIVGGVGTAWRMKQGHAPEVQP